MHCSGGRKKPAGRELPQGRTWKSAPTTPLKNVEKQTPPRADSFHVLHKVPAGESPYVKAKHVQLVDKDPNRAISLFWAAINTGDRVSSALKDMAIVMKQVGRAEEAVEAIKSFRYLCSADAQESLDNVLLDLYKRCGRMDEQIELLEHKLKLIEEGLAFGGKRTKIARSQGKKFHLSIDQERARLLGNLAWVYLQQEKFQIAEAFYRKALVLVPDKNKQCNLAICLMQTGRISEAKSLLKSIQPSDWEEYGPDSCMKSFERACEMLAGLESQLMKGAIGTQIQRSPVSSITRTLSSSGSVGGDQNPQKQVEEVLETEMQRSSSGFTLNRNLNSMRPINKSQNHGDRIERELIKTELPRSSSYALIGILNSPAFLNGNQNHVKIASRSRNGWEDGDSGGEIKSHDSVFGNLRWENDGHEEMLCSPPPPPAIANLDSSASIEQDHTRILGSGGSRWGNDSDEEPLFSDENSTVYTKSPPTSNSGRLNRGVSLWCQNSGVENQAGAHSRVGNNAVEEEAFFFDKNLYSNLPADLPTMKWIADSSPITIQGNSKTTPIRALTTTVTQPANGNWRRRANDLPVLAQESSKSASQELSRQSPIDGERRASPELPVWCLQSSIEGDKEFGSSQVPVQGNSQLLPQEDLRRANIPLENSEIKQADCAADKWTSGDLPVSSTKRNTKCSSVISVIGSGRQADCTYEKLSIQFGNLGLGMNPAIQIRSPIATENSQPVGSQNLTGIFLGSVNGNSSHKSDVSAIGSRRWADMVEEEEELDNVSSSMTGNPKIDHYPPAFSCGKTWAEMVEEEEALAVLNLNADGKQMTCISKQIESWNDRDMFPDENLNANIMRSAHSHPPIQSLIMSPPPEKRRQVLQDSTDSSQVKIETVAFDRKEDGSHMYSTPNTYNNASTQRKSLFSTGRERKLSARRSLSFEPQEKREPALDHSPMLTKLFDVDDYSYLQSIGSGSKRRGNRLRVFQEMTLPDSPRA